MGYTPITVHNKKPFSFFSSEMKLKDSFRARKRDDNSTCFHREPLRITERGGNSFHEIAEYLGFRLRSNECSTSVDNALKAGGSI